jgi:hypothetical protein
VQPGQDCEGPDCGTFGKLLDRGRNRDSLTDPLVRTERVEIAKAVLVEHLQKVASSEDDDVVETVSPYTAEEAFAPGIGRSCRMLMMGRVRRELSG